MADSPLRIDTRHRWRLLAKSALLGGLAAVFAVLAAVAALKSGWLLPVRGALALFFFVILLFLGWTAVLALADAVRGQAMRVSGAVALASRSSGVSFRLPDGRSAEFLLTNPGPPLVPGARYTVTVGRHTRVLVEPPLPET